MTRRGMTLLAWLAAALAWTPVYAWGEEPPLVFGILQVEPFFIQRKDASQQSGLYAETLRAIITAAQLDAVITPLPLARVLSGIDEGTIAGTLAVPSPSILDIAIPVAEVMRLESVVITRKEMRIATLADLHGKSVCLLRGSSFDQRLNEDALIGKEKVSDLAQCVRMLDAQRVDAMAAPEVALAWHVKQFGIEMSAFASPFVLNESTVSMLLSKKAASDALTRSIARGVALAHENGTIAAILKRYTE